MITRYRTSILKLLNDLHNARQKPFENILKWQSLQECLIKKLIYVENRIRIHKQEIKEINVFRKNSNLRLSKMESLNYKLKIEKKEYLIAKYKRILEIFHSIGNAIAFTFIDKFDIKILTSKETSGFISGKTGFKKEKQIFRKAFKREIIAILNDLTSVLRYGDITLITEFDTKYVEVKTSKIKNNRTERQKENAKKVINYIETDFAIDLFGIKEMKRRAIGSQEINYIADVNELIEISKVNGSVYRLVESGVLYHVSHENTFEDEDIKLVFKKYSIEKPFAYMINLFKFQDQGYYPFSLSISGANNYLDFLEGVFTIIIYIDFHTIDKIAEKYNLTRIFDDDSRYLSFKNKSKISNVSHFKVSMHYFQRIPFEFVSLNWLFTNSFERYAYVSS